MAGSPVVGRLSLQEGFERLLPHYSPGKACGLIERALHEEDLQLYCNGNLLTVDFVKHQCRLVVETVADGRRKIWVRHSGAGLSWNPSIDYPWEVDAEGIEKLLPPPPAPKRKPETKPRKAGGGSKKTLTGEQIDKYRAAFRQVLKTHPELGGHHTRTARFMMNAGLLPKKVASVKVLARWIFQPVLAETE